jgi:hypothetical protein
LAIQIANRSGLRRRLDKTDDTPPAVFSSPASRVAWAKETFEWGASGSSLPAIVAEISKYFLRHTPPISGGR